MKICFQFLLVIALLTAAFISCKEEEPVIIQQPEPEPEPQKINLSGYVQKGPFINGTTIIITELDDSLAATGKTFTTQITDNRGTFSIKTSQLDYYNLQLIASGFYFDEVKGEKSIAQLTLFALADVSEAGQINVNVLSHLEKDRVMYLINQGKSFIEAKRQAQREILAIFGIVKEDIGNSETLDISQQGEDNAILLAISAILQGDNTVAELSELLADITSDIREDGTLDSEALKSELKNNAIRLNLSNIRQYVQKRYAELGVDASIPDFERYIDSDGDGILNKDEDDTPDDFIFEAQENVEISTIIISNEVIISGISKDGFITATIQNGKFIKNGKVLQDSIINLINGDKIKIQITSSHNYNQSTIASIKFGDINKQFTANTDPYIPDDFSFVTIESAIKNTPYTSNTVTISGLRYSALATIKNGSLIKNGIEQTTDTSTVTNGDQLAIKVSSHPDWQNNITATLKIGSAERVFTVINKNNLWTRKAKFPGEANSGQVSFSLNGKMYVGLGRKTHGATTEFYEYNPNQNTWRKIASFPGTAREKAISFTLNGKAYVGLGNSIDSGGGYDATLKDFWEYNSETNIWKYIGDFPGISRSSASCFIIGDNAYIGLGFEWRGSEYFLSDFWKFNVSTKAWSRISDFLGSKRYGSISFSFKSKGYIIGGYGYSDKWIDERDIWEYDPKLNLWSRRQDSSIEITTYGIAFTLNDRVYIGTGQPNFAGEGYFYEYNPQTENWILLDGYEVGSMATVTILNNKGYYFKGNEVWEYTP